MDFEKLKSIYIEDKISRNKNEGSTIVERKKELSQVKNSNRAYRLFLLSSIYTAYLFLSKLHTKRVIYSIAFIASSALCLFSYKLKKIHIENIKTKYGFTSIEDALYYYDCITYTSIDQEIIRQEKKTKSL